MTCEVLRLSAFPLAGSGGNPAGVVLDARELTDNQMQQIAQEVGYSETAFLTSREGNRFRVRYFSPEIEVDFCGHATIATAVALGETHGLGSYIFETNTGDVAVDVEATQDGIQAKLSASRAELSKFDTSDLAELLSILDIRTEDLKPGFEPMIATAGNSHPVFVLESRELLNSIEYDFDRCQEMCRRKNWVTLQLVVMENESRWHSRNPFAFGGVVEDPATGSAAIALGIYLRDTGIFSAGHSFEILQGEAMGRPSLLKVEIGQNSCSVMGGASPISDSLHIRRGVLAQSKSRFTSPVQS